jgi:hypothetical protein
VEQALLTPALDAATKKAGTRLNRKFVLLPACVLRGASRPPKSSWLKKKKKVLIKMADY